MKKPILICSLLFISSICIRAQEVSRQVMANGGDEVGNNSSSTFGQQIVGDLSNSSLLLHQGYQQNVYGQNVGIIESSLIEQVSIFPNPTSERINVIFKAGKAISGQVELRSLLGELLHRIQYKNQKDFHTTLEVGMLPDGVYTISFLDSTTQLLAIEKLLIQK